MEITVNYLAVLVGAVVAMAIGALWYSPKIFGNMWIRESGLSPEALAANKAKGMGKAYTLSFIFTLLSVYVLAHFVALLSVTSLAGVVELVFWIWLGFSLPVFVGAALWEGRSVKYIAVNALQQLIALGAAGKILILFQ